MIAVSLSSLGIPVCLVTATAGRSAVLVSSLILSVAELRGRVFSMVGAGIGIAASALLFVGGDIATAVLPSSVVVAALIGIGYVLWMIWLVSAALGLLRLATVSKATASR
jgi:hypothetical protein